MVKPARRLAPASLALWVIGTHKLIHHVKVLNQRIDNVISVPNTYPPGSDLSDAKRYPTFEQPVPGRINTSNGMSKCAGSIHYFW